MLQILPDWLGEISECQNGSHISVYAWLAWKHGLNEPSLISNLSFGCFKSSEEMAMFLYWSCWCPPSVTSNVFSSSSHKLWCNFSYTARPFFRSVETFQGFSASLTILFPLHTCLNRLHGVMVFLFFVSKQNLGYWHFHVSWLRFLSRTYSCSCTCHDVGYNITCPAHKL